MTNGKMVPSKRLPGWRGSWTPTVLPDQAGLRDQTLTRWTAKRNRGRVDVRISKYSSPANDWPACTVFRRSMDCLLVAS
jgi:hypothetical protein